MSAIVRAAGSAFNRLAIKRAAAKLSLGDLADKLEEAGKTLERRYGAVLDTDANRDKLRHVVGIERWGQRRLESFLGKEAPGDELDDYAPSPSASWRDLKLAFANTRRRTVALARQVEQANIAADRKVAHSQHGDLTAREWLYYLRLHADMESRRIR